MLKARPLERFYDRTGADLDIRVFRRMPAGERLSERLDLWMKQHDSDVLQTLNSPCARPTAQATCVSTGAEVPRLYSTVGPQFHVAADVQGSWGVT